MNTHIRIIAAGLMVALAAVAPARAAELVGSGTAADPYRVASVADLRQLAADVNGGRNFAGQHVALTADIDGQNAQLTPIGHSADCGFAGTFAGGGHTISNVSITDTTDFTGLFGYATAASSLSAVRLSGVTVSGAGAYCGAVVAYSDGHLQGCSASGTVTGALAVGGVVGQLTGSADSCSSSATVTCVSTTAGTPCGGVAGLLYGQNATVTRSWFSGTVDADGTKNLVAGGLVGYVALGTVDACFSTGTVLTLGTDARTGGVAGYVGGTVSNCYNSGFVSNEGGRSTGGVTGYVAQFTDARGTVHESVVRSCYTSGYLLAETYQYDKTTECREVLGQIASGASPTIADVWFDAQMCDKTSTAHRALTSALTGTSLDGFSQQTWLFAQGSYPRLRGIAESDDALLSASVLKLDEGFPDVSRRVQNDITLTLLGGTTLLATGHCGTVAGSSYKLNGTFGTDTLRLVSPEGATRTYVMQFTPRFLAGAGTQANPLLIKTKADLVKLSQVTTDLKQAYPDTYFKLANDIDLELDTAFVGLAASNSDVTVHFAGHLDGAGHAIHRMKLTGVVWTTAPTATTAGQPSAFGSHSYKGFIGRLDTEGSVSNLTIAADCELEFWAYSGAVVGYNYGTVECCVNAATVRGYSSAIGGIVGMNQTGATVTGCLNEGSVTAGFRNAGGIAGTSDGDITECANVGDVRCAVLSGFVAESRLSTAGGVVAAMSGGHVRHCLNAGTVSGRTNVGGLVGSYSATGTEPRVTASLTYGAVLATTGSSSSLGAVAGSGSSLVASDALYDAQVTGIKAVAGADRDGTVATLTRTLTSGEAVSGLADSLWNFSSGQYPVLKRFATSDKLAAARAIVVTMSDADVASHLTRNATLAATQGLSWTLRRGTDFGISGSTLVVPQNVTTTVADTLVAANGGVTKPIALVAVPGLQLQGDGTLQSPYLITCPDDWNEAARYMADIGETYKDQYLQLAADITFTDSVPITTMGAFGGTLLGAGHTVTTGGTLFAAIGATGAVSDLNIAGTIAATGTETGALAVTCAGTVTEVANLATVTGASNSSNVGGLVAEAGATAVLTDCVNSGAVTAKSGNAGGIAGTALSGARFVSCANIGATVSARIAGGIVGTGAGIVADSCLASGIVGTEGTTNYAGGIVGSASGSDTLCITASQNLAAVTASYQAGGIVGAARTSTSSSGAPLVLTGCDNAGNVNTTAAGSSNTEVGTGGIAGTVSPGSRIASCTNAGAVTAAKSNGVGGIAGRATVTGNALIFTDNDNSGTVTATEGQNAGGIVGALTDVAQVTSCSNTGAVQARLIAGGIVGSMSGADITIARCWNAGAVTTQRNGAAGINAYCGYCAMVSECFNVGTITAGTGFAGGLGAQVGCAYERCYNRGTVTGPGSVGGLVGIRSSVYGGTQVLSFTDCYNAGRVTATDDGGKWGGVLGNMAYWDAYSSISGTSYVTDWGVSTTDSIGTPVTVAELAAATRSGWECGDGATLPMIASLATEPCARAFAAAVVLSTGDTYQCVTHGFTLGLPDGVEWTASSDLVVISGSQATVARADTAQVTLTATCGDFTAEWPLTVKAQSGVGPVEASKTVVSRAYYNLAGQPIVAPEPRQVCIEVVRYSDGTTAVRKLVQASQASRQ